MALGEEASLTSFGPQQLQALLSLHHCGLRVFCVCVFSILLHRVIGTHGILMYGSDREGDKHLLREGACPATQSHVGSLRVAGRQEAGVRGPRPVPSWEFPGEKQDRQSTQPRVGRAHSLRSASVNNSVDSEQRRGLYLPGTWPWGDLGQG